MKLQGIGSNGELGRSFDLMFDLVLNHASQKNKWFQEYLSGNLSYANFFIDVDPNLDLSMVVPCQVYPCLLNSRLRR